MPQPGKHATTAAAAVQGKRRYYLVFTIYVEGNKKNPFVYALVSFITFWILYSYLVPISLFVTLEIVKFWQGFVFINFDRNMKDRAGSNESARCRNSNLNEDLGKVDYIFSDKTGTLTSNEMRLRIIAIKGEPLGDLNKSLEARTDLEGLSAIKYFSERMYHALQVRCGTRTCPPARRWLSQWPPHATHACPPATHSVAAVQAISKHVWRAWHVRMRSITSSSSKRLCRQSCTTRPSGTP
jgi:magnesium-transporting ATPase (P-type)